MECTESVKNKISHVTLQEVDTVSATGDYWRTDYS